MPSHLGMPSDGATLARRFLAGGADAARRIGSWVRLAASPFRRRLGDDWEDAVHESLVEVTEALQAGKVRDLERLRAWVFRTTAHTCLDRVRAQARWSWVDAEEAGLTTRPSALGRLLAEGEVRGLLDLAARCPEHCRLLWEMILQGLTYREMSERTGLAEGTLRVRVLRCRRQAQALAGGGRASDAEDRGVTNSPAERHEAVNGDEHEL